jgi:hypothetical protein
MGNSAASAPGAREMGTNPFTGKSFDPRHTDVFAFGHDTMAGELLRVTADHLEVPIFPSSGELKGQHYAFGICHSNGCTRLFSAQRSGDVKIDQIFALGTDWTSHNFAPGELKGAKVTFFVAKDDPVWKIPGQLMKIDQDTPGIGVKIPFERLSDIPRGMANLVTKGRADTDRYPVVHLKTPPEQSPGLTSPVSAHSLTESYFPAIRGWLESNGQLQQQIRERTNEVGGASEALRPRSAAGTGLSDNRGGVSAEVGVRARDFENKPPKR